MKILGANWLLGRVQIRERRVKRVLHPPKVNKEALKECFLSRKVWVADLYVRCLHRCAYCYSEHPGTPKKLTIKINAPEIVRRELEKYRDTPFIVNLGSGTDPYQPLEAVYCLTRKVVKLVIRAGKPLYICTKSTLVTRDLDLLGNYSNCWVGISISSLSSKYAQIFEQGAPKPSERINCAEKLLESGVPVVVRIDPILPYVNDEPGGIRELIEEIASIGVKHVVAGVLKLDRRGFIFNGNPNRPTWKKPLKEALEVWGGEKLVNKYLELYRDKGELLYGYLVPKEGYRWKILSFIAEECKRRGIAFTTCRMGLNIKRRLTRPLTPDGYWCACYAFPILGKKL